MGRWGNRYWRQPVLSGQLSLRRGIFDLHLAERRRAAEGEPRAQLHVKSSGRAGGGDQERIQTVVLKLLDTPSIHHWVAR
jgi:hypothetical protein